MTIRRYRDLHREDHGTGRIGWLRAAVLGANDGILSTASLIVGVAAADASAGTALLTGLSGLVAGAMSMAAGEYVSVSSQADTERAEEYRERAELAASPEAERAELAAIYRQRGLDAPLALQVADQLMAHDALGAHMRDELGITEQLAARPLQAAAASGASFISGAIIPVLLTPVFHGRALVIATMIVALLLLATTGALGARAGGANMIRGAGRVVLWGALAMIATAGIGAFFGTRI